MEFHLNKRKKHITESCKTGHLITVAIVPKGVTNFLGSSSSKKSNSSKSGESKNVTPLFSQVLYEAVTRQKMEDKCPSLQERQQCEFFFSKEALQELFEEVMERGLLTLPKLRSLEDKKN